jgi:hypothetical protein
VISTGNVRLRDARADCDISANGNMKVVELSDRARKSNPSLTDLRGKVACMSTKAVTGYYADNTNSGGRRNYCEANVFSLDGKLYANLNKSGNTCYMDATSRYDNDAIAGYSFCGTISGGGNYRFRYRYNTTNSRYHFIEVIGWSSGFFSGSADYKVSYLGYNREINETPVLNMNGSYPYVTMIIQSFSPGGTYIRSDTEIYDAWIEKA